MNLTGWRTIIVAVVGGTITPFLTAKLGLTLTADQQTALVSAIMAGLMVLMRLVTKTPVGKAVPPPVLPAPVVTK